MEQKLSTFETLYNINVSANIKQKGSLNYLSWADAWAALKKVYPNATYKIYSRTVKTTEERTTHDATLNQDIIVKTETENEIPYFTDGKTCYVQVGVTIEDVEYVEYLPIMDNKNGSVNVTLVTMTQVNKAIQRAFVKACARHGLGLYIYSGEDLPEADRPAPIDYAALAEKSRSIVVKPVSDEVFKVMFDDTLSVFKRQDLSNEAVNALGNFAQEIIPMKPLHLSELTNKEHGLYLQKLNYFINLLKEVKAI